jgi:hypothetical protein
MPDETNKGTKRTPRDESPLPSPARFPSLPEMEGFIPLHGGYDTASGWIDPGEVR